MLAWTPFDQLRKMSDYDCVTIYLFRQMIGGTSVSSYPEEIPFDLDDIRAAIARCKADGLLKSNVKNPADVKYTYDARRNLPDEVEQLWPVTWLPVAKGYYKFRRTKRKNIIDLSSLASGVKLETAIDQTPPFVSKLLGMDEQATFTRVRNAGLINVVLGVQAWPIQGHHRTTVSYGQIEVDEVQAGLDGEQATIVPISGKGGADKLSWSQVLNLNTYGVEKAPRPGMLVRSMGLWRDPSGAVWIVEFTPDLDIDNIEISKVRRIKFLS